MSPLNAASEHDDEYTFDVIIAGSGGAGMAAAIVCALHGLQVVLLEKTPYFGGATAWSGGGCWVPNNHLMQWDESCDDAATAATYIRNVVAEALNEDLLARFLKYSPQMLRYFDEKTQVHFELIEGLPDYYQELPGALPYGRMLVPLDYEGRELGDWFEKLRPPLKEFNAPGGMMIGFKDAEHLLKVKQSLPSMLYALRMVGSCVADRLRGYSRGTRITMGNALAGRLLRSAIDAGVTLWNNCTATELLRDGERVSGMRVLRDGRALRLLARKGVVLASGGFSNDPEMRARYIPYADQHQSLMPEGNTGDGLKMACGIGAQMQQRNPRNASWIAVSLRQRPDGSVQKFPHLTLDKPKPGCIAVNQHGCRFGNEASHGFIEDMHASGSVPAWLICDDKFIRKYGLGLVRPGGFGLRNLLREGYVIEAPTLSKLAQRLAMPAEALSATVFEFNCHAAMGKDPHFGRGSTAFDRSMGDPAHQPNPSLGPLETAPYYAVKIFPGSTTTTLGLKVDGHGRALDAEGAPIAGLYACGLDMNSLWAGRPPSSGCNNSLNLTLGYLIGRHIAGADGGE